MKFTIAIFLILIWFAWAEMAIAIYVYEDTVAIPSVESIMQDRHFAYIESLNPYVHDRDSWEFINKFCTLSEYLGHNDCS